MISLITIRNSQWCLSICCSEKVIHKSQSNFKSTCTICHQGFSIHETAIKRHTHREVWLTSSDQCLASSSPKTLKSVSKLPSNFLGRFTMNVAYHKIRHAWFCLATCTFLQYTKSYVVASTTTVMRWLPWGLLVPSAKADRVSSVRQNHPSSDEVNLHPVVFLIAKWPTTKKTLSRITKGEYTISFRLLRTTRKRECVDEIIKESNLALGRHWHHLCFQVWLHFH